ncbi:MAG: hypothetical protein ACKOZW_08985 [Cyanobium sp.]
MPTTTLLVAALALLLTLVLLRWLGQALALALRLALVATLVALLLVAASRNGLLPSGGNGSLPGWPLPAPAGAPR